MTDREAFNFIWEWRRHWFDTDQYVKRFWRNGWDIEAIKSAAERTGITFSESMEQHLLDFKKED
jgi:hypothetical protein